MEQEKNPGEMEQPAANKQTVDIVRIVTPTNDIRSQKGQFGWETIGQTHIPYVFRGNDSDRYVALRIVNQVVLPHFCTVFSQDLFDILVIPSVSITENERKLYNEINAWHCSSFYGLNAFQRGEQLVKVDDIMKLYDVLNFLYARFIMRRLESHPIFGFMAFDGQSNLVPYYKINGTPCFPVVYFEGDEKYLKDKSMPVGDFEECILRLLMKLQKVTPCCRQVKVIAFNDLKMYYAKGTVFSECWITKDHNFLKKPEKADASILKIANVDLIDMAGGQLPRNSLPVLLMNAKRDSQRMPPPPPQKR